MSFSSSAGNLQRNLYLDRSPAGYALDSVEAIAAPNFLGERVQFVHGYAGKLCLHFAEGVQAYSAGFSAHSLIGSLPSGPASLFLPDAVWASHIGPLRKYGPDLRPLLERYFVPHGGPWTKCLGIYPTAAGLVLAFAFSGGPRVWAPELHLTLVGESDTEPRALEERALASRPGYVDSLVLLESRLYAGGETGLAILKPDGSLLKEIPLAKGIHRLTGCIETLSVGGFAKDPDERWRYREFDAAGAETFDYTMSGSSVPGRVVFDANGSRYLMSETRLIKLGPDGGRVWSYTLKGGHTESPSFLAYKDGCAFVDGGTLVLLDSADGAERLRIPLGRSRVTSPPYLDAAGTIWLGLGDGPHSLLKAVLKP